MKDQILKLAGVKSEAAFYKKFPSEAAFMKVHGKALKKAAMGASMVKDQLTQLTDFSNPPMAEFGVNQGPSYAPQNFQFSPLYQNPIGGVKPMNLPSGGAPNLSQYGQSQMGAQARGYGQMMNQFGNTGTVSNAGAATKGLGSAAGYIQPAMDIIQGIGMIADQKKAVKQARMDADVTGVQAEAAGLTGQPIMRQYDRPEYAIAQPGQLSSSFGTGTNILQSRNGIKLQDGGPVGGNPTEIQNTYAPNDLYEDLGYEPLDNPDQLKQYQLGGDIGGGGFGTFMNQGGGDLLGNLASMTHGKRGPSAGNQIGKGIGAGVGTAFFGPVGGMVGGALGDVVGGMFDKSGKRIDAANKITGQNIDSIIGQQFGQGIQQQYGSFMEDGGYVSNDWTPQVITKFGEYDVEDLFQPPNDADMLRAGGHLKSYTAPTERAMQTYAMGGELQVYKGEAEPISTNPYLPDGGETIMFRGPSHENGGMPISYGQSPVEVEGGEPATKLEDGGTGENNLVVFGNLIESDSKRKFKNIVADIAKNETRQNKIIDKSTNALLDLNPKNAFDKMKLDSLNANIMGANMKLQNYAQEKMDLAAKQNAINETAEEYGLVADDLAKGKIVRDKSKAGMAKYGAAIRKAVDGDSVTVNEDYGITPWRGNVGVGNKYGKSTASSFDTQQWNEVAKRLGFKGKGNKEFQEFLLTNPESAPLIKARHQQLYGKDPFVDEKLGYGWAAGDLLKPRTAFDLGTLKDKEKEVASEATTPIETKQKFPWMQVANTLIPYIRPTDQMDLDPSQLTPEMFALSQNQLEPVSAQGYRPQLTTPINISLQAGRNANQADFNAMQKMAEYSPAAQSMLAGQKYAANAQSFGQEAGINQAAQLQAANQNIATLNEAQLKNLGIFDTQYGRQAQAKSNTKAVTQAALSSMADKIAKNKLENRTLGTYENLYNYRFDPQGRAINMNPLAQFNVDAQSMTPEQLDALSAKKRAEAKTKESKTKEKSRNGSIVKAIKNL